MRCRSPTVPAALLAGGPRLALLGAVLAVVAPAGTLHADIQNPPARGRGRANEPAATARARPASATDASVRVALGGSVEITLRARGQFGKTIAFLLRDAPVHGTLGEPRPTGRDTAVVTYRHRAGDGAAADGFTYAAQAPGSPVSALATVEVRVLDDPPRVAVAGDPDLDFGAVPAGGEARREFTLENRGGGLAIGTLEPPPPWSVEGGAPAAGYRLGRDERQSFTLVFKPGLARNFASTLAFGPGADQITRLAGTGLREAGSIPPPLWQETRESALAAVQPPAGPSSPGAATLVAKTGSAAPTPAPGRALSGSGADGAGGQRAGAPAIGQPPPVLEAAPAWREDAPVQKLALQARGAHSLTLSWPAPKPKPAGYRVERRHLWLDDGVLRVEWDPHPSVRIEQPGAGDTVQATLRALPAGLNQTVRVLATDNRGALSAPSAPLQAATLPERTWWRFVTPLRSLGAGLAVCLFLLWRRRAEEMTNDEGRMAEFRGEHRLRCSAFVIRHSSFPDSHTAGPRSPARAE